MDRANVMAKIRKMVALAAPGSGATPSEASTAKALAVKLMQDHGLTPQDFRPAAVKPARSYSEGNEYSFRWSVRGGYAHFGGADGTTSSVKF